MEKIKYGSWTDWIKFEDLYEYYGLINNDLKTNRGSTIDWNGISGKALQDNGFRLRSKEYGNGSFKSLPLKISLNQKNCLLVESDVGVYCLKITSDDRNFHYVGVSYSPNNAIHGRLVHHFIKIAGTCSFAGGRYSDDSPEFKKMREYFRDIGINTSLPEFFKTSVNISFIKFPNNNNILSKVMKIEGMAMQAFRHYFGIIPELNSRDETYNIENFPFKN